MFWISLILVSLLFVFYRLWPKIGKYSQKVVPNQYDLYKPSTNETQCLIIEKVVYFDAGSCILEGKEIRMLKDWLALYVSQSLVSVFLVGSADHTGNLAVNRKLVKERIRSIQKIMVSFGISPEKIKSEARTPQFGKTSKEREQFRSVAIKLTVSGSE